MTSDFYHWWKSNFLRSFTLSYPYFHTHPIISPTSLSIYTSIHPSIHFLSIHPSIHPSSHLSFHSLKSTVSRGSHGRHKNCNKNAFKTRCIVFATHSLHFSSIYSTLCVCGLMDDVVPEVVAWAKALFYMWKKSKGMRKKQKPFFFFFLIFFSKALVYFAKKKNNFMTVIPSFLSRVTPPHSISFVILFKNSFEFQ